jgi:hypothetical protein
MRRFPLFWTLVPLLAASQGVASAQAMVENALLTGRSAASTAPVQGIGSALGNLEKTLQKSLGSADSRPAPPVVIVSAAAVVAPAAPAVRYQDPKSIETGTVYDELIRRFGPAALEITTGPLTKTLSYVSRTGAFQVEMREDKVISIVDVAALRR